MLEDDEAEHLRTDKMIKKILQIKTLKKGVILYEDGTVYEGERMNGRCHGKGKLVFANRKGIYDGEFYQGKRQGYGV